VISFSGPAWWYGPVLIVQKGNPLKVTGYDQLKGKKVGSITGSAADLYLRRIGITTTEFKAEVDELQSLNQGRLDAVLEDDVVYKEFADKTPNNSLEPLWSIPVPRTSSAAAATAWHAWASARKIARCAPPTPRRSAKSAPTAK